jgi:HKD family nuclease
MVVGSCNGEIAATKFSVTAFGGGTFHWTQSGLLFTATLANDKAWNGAKVKLLGRNYSSKTQSQWEGEVEYSYNVK